MACGLICAHGIRTLRLDTRSAVSNNVNCPIWSTIPEILGFELAAVAVDSHLRAGVGCWRCENAAGAIGTGLEGLRSARAQHRIGFIYELDIADDRDYLIAGEVQFYTPPVQVQVINQTSVMSKGSSVLAASIVPPRLHLTIVIVMKSRLSMPSRAFFHRKNPSLKQLQLRYPWRRARPHTVVVDRNTRSRWSPNSKIHCRRA